MSNSEKINEKARIGERTLKVVHSNKVRILSTETEVVLDFISAYLYNPTANIVATVSMTIPDAKALLYSLSQSIDDYEQNFGRVYAPGEPREAGDLVKSFFGIVGNVNGDYDEEDEDEGGPDDDEI